MAQQTRGQQAKPAERADTMRTVLRRERVLKVPEKATAEQVAEALAVLYPTDKRIQKAATPEGWEAWVVIGPFAGASDTKAIEAYAGKPGQPDSKPGIYKAPPSRSWAGGEIYDKPPEPKVERRRFDG